MHNKIMDGYLILSILQQNSTPSSMQQCSTYEKNRLHIEVTQINITTELQKFDKYIIWFERRNITISHQMKRLMINLDEIKPAASKCHRVEQMIFWSVAIEGLPPSLEHHQTQHVPQFRLDCQCSCSSFYTTPHTLLCDIHIYTLSHFPAQQQIKTATKSR